MKEKNFLEVNRYFYFCQNQLQPINTNRAIRNRFEQSYILKFILERIILRVVIMRHREFEVATQEMCV